MNRRAATTKLASATVIALACSIPIAAHAAPGAPDPAFGHLSNGTVLADHGKFDSIVKVLRQTDGKIVTIANGSQSNGEPSVVVTRYLANGALDSSFGVGGVFLKIFPGATFLTDGVLQPDGKIVVVGMSSSPADFFITRLRTNGTLDPAFTPAHPTTNFGGSSVDGATSVALGHSGTIVVAGRSGENTALARYTSTGALDSTFSGDGLTTHDFGGQSEADAVAVLPSGKIIVAGTESNGTSPRVLVARFNITGALDATFGSGGRVATNSTPITSTSTLLLQGTKIVIAGIVSITTAALTRYDANGARDNTFGSTGTTQVAVGKFVRLNDLFADTSGRLVAVGQSAFQDNFPDVHAFLSLFRFSAAGVRDASFGCSGRVLTEVLGNGAGTNYDSAIALSGAADGNDILAGGLAIDFNGDDLPPADDLLARYDGDTTSAPGYALFRGNGGISAFGNAPACGSMTGLPLNAPIVGLAFNPASPGTWSVASDGGIFSFGTAPFKGSMGGKHLNAPIVGMAATSNGQGYWMVATDGGIFAFGNASFKGSMGGQHLNSPIVGMAPTHDGKGYWLVARDGGVFAFGTAAFKGSMGGRHLNAPVVGMAATPDNKGYWLVASDGGIFSFGSAHFSGSTGNIHLAAPVVGMAADPDGVGYWLAARDGGLFAFSAKFSGSTGGTPFPASSNRSTIGIAAAP
jgi:uncharacterized delta-60 repeat protein